MYFSYFHHTKICICNLRHYIIFKYQKIQENIAGQKDFHCATSISPTVPTPICTFHILHRFVVVNKHWNWTFLTLHLTVAYCYIVAVFLSLMLNVVRTSWWNVSCNAAVDTLPVTSCFSVFRCKTADYSRCVTLSLSAVVLSVNHRSIDWPIRRLWTWTLGLVSDTAPVWFACDTMTWRYKMCSDLIHLIAGTVSWKIFLTVHFWLF